MKLSHPENIDINRIKTIIFDWGGVITNISTDIAIQAYKDLGHPRIEEFLNPDATEDIFFRLEKGEAGPRDLFEKINEELEVKADQASIEKAYNSLLLDTPKIRIDLLKKLREHFQLYLLSNTNIIHTTCYLERIRNEFQLDFPSLFHKVFYSYELGLRKPGSEIFEKIIREHKIDLQSTLFLDDTKTNITTARSLGIQSIQIDEIHPIEKIFHDWL